VLNAGASPLMRPIQHHTWETFSRPWEVDVRQTFHWIREALLLPMARNSTVITLSSGAALFGSPLSGGYSGAKATIRFITDYADGESTRAGLGIRFVSVLPKLTASTTLGAAAATAYSQRDNISIEEYFHKRGPGPSPQDVGRHITELVTSAEHKSGAYLLTPQGLSPAP
jgi:NADP-dependent 3-hydroxy acid dehydrogenase YdfG